jgi:hypothetical protein
MVNLFTAGKTINSKLPSKDLNFQGKQAFQINFAQGQAAPWRR